jgi:Cytochrome oxidase complex assembly protein 1
MESSTPPPVPPSSSPPVPIPPKRNWWQRNWKWVVPTGCLTLIIVAVLFSTTVVVLIFSAIRSSDVYRTAVARAKADPRVIEAIGTPVTESWFVSGSTSVEGGSGKSDLSIPIHGPKGEATIYAVATKSAGEWEYSRLVVKIKATGQTIDLKSRPEE